MGVDIKNGGIGGGVNNGWGRESGNCYNRARPSKIGSGRPPNRARRGWNNQADLNFFGHCDAAVPLGGCTHRRAKPSTVGTARGSSEPWSRLTQVLTARLDGGDVAQLYRRFRTPHKTTQQHKQAHPARNYERGCVWGALCSGQCYMRGTNYTKFAKEGFHSQRQVKWQSVIPHHSTQPAHCKGHPTLTALQLRKICERDEPTAPVRGSFFAQEGQSSSLEIREGGQRRAPFLCRR